MDLLFLFLSPYLAYRGVYALRCVLDYDGTDKTYAEAARVNRFQLNVCAVSLLLTLVESARLLLAQENTLPPSAYLSMLVACAISAYLGHEKYREESADEDDDDDEGGHVEGSEERPIRVRL